MIKAVHDYVAALPPSKVIYFAVVLVVPPLMIAAQSGWRWGVTAFVITVGGALGLTWTAHRFGPRAWVLAFALLLAVCLLLRFTLLAA